MAVNKKRITLTGLRIRVRLIESLSRIGFKEDYYLIVLSILIGGATGLGAHVFFWLIDGARHFAYGDGDAGGGLFSGRAFMLVVLPTVGALFVGYITHYFAREAKGHGVPEVMDAIHRQGGVIRPRVAIAKSVASAFTIGSGGSAGTEGPIIQIGAAIGSTFGQVLHIERRQMSVLVACGAAAGIAAIFNAPIAGVLFALEIFLKDFSFRTFSPVVFASVLSGSVTHALRHDADVGLFEVADIAPGVFGGVQLPYYLVLGVVCALVAVAFIRMLYKIEDIADVTPMPEQFKPAAGAVLLGVTGIIFWWLTADVHMPSFFGNGYPAIEAATARDTLFAIGAPALLGICALKLLATCFTLGSGGSGGVFAPSLLMGASIGGAFGLGLCSLGLIDPGNVHAYALVGMAAVVAGTTHAPLTAIVMLYEITREPRVILPIMFAAIIATAGAQLLCRDSIYTLKLRRRGLRLGTLADLTIMKRILADDLPLAAAHHVHPDDPMQKLLDLAGEAEAADFVVVDDQAVYQGLVVATDIRTALLQPEAVPLLVVGDLLRPGVPVVQPGETLDVILDKFAGSDVQSLPMAAEDDDARIAGLITRQAVMNRYYQELDRQAG